MLLGRHLRNTQLGPIPKRSQGRRSIGITLEVRDAGEQEGKQDRPSLWRDSQSGRLDHPATLVITYLVLESADAVMDDPSHFRLYSPWT